MDKELHIKASSEYEQSSTEMNFDLSAFYTLARGDDLSVFGTQFEAISQSIDRYAEALGVDSPLQAFGILVARESLFLPDDLVPLYPENITVPQSDVDIMKTWLGGKSVQQIAQDMQQTQEQVAKRMDAMRESVGAVSLIQLVAVLGKEGFIAPHWDDSTGFSFEPRDDFDTTRIIPEEKQAPDSQVDEGGVNQQVFLSPEQEELIALVGEGLTRAEIAERMLISPKNVSHRLSRLNANLRRDGKPEVHFLEGLSPQQQKLMDLIGEGLTRGEAAQQLGILPASVKNVLWELNIKLHREGKPRVQFAESRFSQQERLVALIKDGIGKARAAQLLNTSAESIRNRLKRFNARSQKEGGIVIQFPQNLSAQQEELVALIDKGLTRAEVAQQLGISAVIITGRLSKLNAKLHREGKPRVQFAESLSSRQERLVALSGEGLTRAEAAQQLGISVNNFSLVLSRLNAKLRKKGEPTVDFVQDLTAAQQELVSLIGEGLTRAEVAKRLVISEYHAQGLLNRLNARLEKANRPLVLFKTGIDLPLQEEEVLVVAQEQEEDAVALEGEGKKVLPKRQQELLSLIGEGLTRPEIAERMGIPPNAVHHLLARLNGRLRKLGEPEVDYINSKEDIVLTPLQEQIIDLIDEGLTRAEAALRLSISQRAIRLSLEAINARLKKEKMPTIAFVAYQEFSLQQQELMSLLYEGATASEVAQHFGVSETSVYELVKTLNVGLRKAFRLEMHFIGESIPSHTGDEETIVFPQDEHEAEGRNKEREQELAALMEEGFTRGEVAERLGITVRNVDSRLSKLNAQLRKEGKPEVHFTFTQGDHPWENELLALVDEGLTVHEAAERLGVTGEHVYSRLRRLNIRLQRENKPTVQFREVHISEKEDIAVLIGEGLTADEAAQRLGVSINEVYFAVMQRNQQRRDKNEPLLYFKEDASSSQGIIELIAQGLTPHQIAEKLNISVYEVSNRIEGATAHFVVERKEELPLAVLQSNEVPIESFTGTYPLDNVMLFPPFYREILEGSLETSDPVTAYEAVAGKITADNYVNYVYYTREVLRTLGVKDLSIAKFIYLLALKRGVIDAALG